MRATSMFALILASGCAPTEPSEDTCNVERFLVADMDGQMMPTDCGDFRSSDANVDDKAMSAAQTCVTNAYAMSLPFRFAYDAVGEHGAHVRYAFSGAVEDTRYVTRLYTYDGGPTTTSGDSSPTVRVRTCQSLYPTMSCKPKFSDQRDICLTCPTEDGETLLCP